MLFSLLGIEILCLTFDYVHSMFGAAYKKACFIFKLPKQAEMAEMM